jgi:transcriptional regulator with XRE-family HTH domain
MGSIALLENIMEPFASILPQGRRMAISDQEKQREAKWLNAAMETRGWENRDLARETGLEANWISQWKIANRPIPDLALFKLAKAFGVSPFAVRPALEEYQQFFTAGSLLDGLTKEDRASVLKIIDGLRTTNKGLQASSREDRAGSAAGKERK